MKKMVLFALLLAAFAGSAQAIVKPKCDVAYRCYYYNYPNPITNPGISFFQSCVWVSPTFLRGIEQFQVPYGTGWDARKFAFANPGSDYFDPNTYTWATDWEFTINPYGPQCKQTRVSNYGNRIDFNDCTDGHSRVCFAN